MQSLGNLSQTTARTAGGTSGTFNEDWEAAFTAASIPPSGTFNERLLLWLNAQMMSSFTNLPSALKAYNG